MTNPTTTLINQLRKDAKKLGLSMLIEFTPSLEWVILSHPNGMQMTIYWAKSEKSFRVNAIEGYRQTGFIATLVNPKSVRACRRIVKDYFSEGYKFIFRQMLNERFQEAQAHPERMYSMEEVTASIKKIRNKTKKLGKKAKKPFFLEIPPSLKETVRDPFLKTLLAKVKKTNSKSKSKIKTKKP
jgi:hypothetical protein